MSTDAWLEPWLGVFNSLSAHGPILELGCGFCDDTVYLERKGYRVIAADLDAQRLVVCDKKTQRSDFLRLDLRSPLPFSGDSFRVILASLCLHYFSWNDTIQAVQEIHSCLAEDGLLLCRLNSTKDVHFGSMGYPPIDPSREDAYFQVGDRAKRFFDEASLRTLFADGWTVEALQEKAITRIGRPKTAWEVALRKTSSSIR